MKTKTRKKWEKPKLTPLTLQGMGNEFCTTGLTRVIVCNEEANGAIATVACHPTHKNNVFS